MRLIIYKAVKADQKEFVEFWSSQYDYVKEFLYEKNIRQKMTEQSILNLYEWKNGRPLFAHQKTSVRENFIKHIDDLKTLQSDISANNFLILFPHGGPIWRIFWLHCWQPDRFPIYDQHVHRAMAFIQNGVIEEIPRTEIGKIESYCNRYLPFHEKFATIEGRAVDKALWVFGKFIKINPKFPTDYKLKILT